MNSQFESKADGPQQTTSHTTKTFCDTLSDPLSESSKTGKSTRLRTSKEIDSRHKPIQTREPTPTGSRLPQSLQKEIGSPQIDDRGSNSQKTKNYHFSKVFYSRKTASIQKFTATIAKFSWPLFRTLQTEKVTQQNRKTWTTTNSSLDRRQLKQQQPPAKIPHQKSLSPSIWIPTRR